MYAISGKKMNNNILNNKPVEAFVSLKYNNLYVVGSETSVYNFHCSNKELLKDLSNSIATVSINADDIKDDMHLNSAKNKEYNDNKSIVVPDSAEITITLDSTELNLLKRVRLFKSLSSIHKTIITLLEEADKEFLAKLHQRLIDEDQKLEVKELNQPLVDNSNSESEKCCNADPKGTYYCAKEHFYTVKEVFLKNLFYIFEEGRVYTLLALVEILVAYTKVDLSDTRFWVRRLAKVLGELRKKGVLKSQKSGKTTYWYLSKASLKKPKMYPFKGVTKMNSLTKTYLSQSDERGSGRIVNESDERGSGR